MHQPMEIEALVSWSFINKRIRSECSDCIYLLLPRRPCRKKRLRNVLWLYTGHERQVIGRQPIALPDLIKRNQPCCGYRILNVAISSVVFKLLTKKINHLLFLFSQE